MQQSSRLVILTCKFINKFYWMLSRLVTPTQSVIYISPQQVKQEEYHLSLPSTLVEEHLIPRPIKVINISEAEEKWRERTKELEREYVELMLEYQETRLLSKPERRTTFYKTQKNVSFADLNSLQTEISELERELGQKDELIYQMRDQISNMQQEISIQNHQQQNLDDELALHKSKFQTLNKQLRGVNEELELKKAELESLAKAQAGSVKQIHVLKLQ